MDKIDLTMEDIVLMIGLIKSAQQKEASSKLKNCCM